MIPAQYFITIQEPCHAGWKNMTVSEKGRFCGSCKKHVHDFSNSTIEEVKKVYSENKGDLCGHISSKVLQEQYVQSQTQKNHFTYLKTFCIAALFCFGANLFTIDSAKANAFQNLKRSFLNVISDNKDSISIKGFVRDKDTHLIVAFATVTALNNDSVIVTTTTNINGEYEVKFPQNKYSKIDIKASFLGYDNHVMKGIAITANKKIEVDIDIEQSETMLEGMMILMHEKTDSVISPNIKHDH